MIDDTTGLSLSLKGAATYDKKNHEAVEAAGRTRELLKLVQRGAHALGRSVQADDRQ